jgi:hypothetical protein
MTTLFALQPNNSAPQQVNSQPISRWLHRAAQFSFGSAPSFPHLFGGNQTRRFDEFEDRRLREGRRRAVIRDIGVRTRIAHATHIGDVI